MKEKWQKLYTGALLIAKNSILDTLLVLFLYVLPMVPGLELSIIFKRLLLSSLVVGGAAVAEVNTHLSYQSPQTRRQS